MVKVRPKQALSTGVAFLSLVLVMSFAHVAEARESKDYGVTTLIAAPITLVIGALFVRDESGIAATGAVVTTVNLSLTDTAPT